MGGLPPAVQQTQFSFHFCLKNQKKSSLLDIICIIIKTRKTRFFLLWHIADFSVCFLCKVPEFFVEKRVLLTAAF